MSATVLEPINIMPWMVTASSVAEPSTGETEWAAATTYAIGDQVIRALTHRLYTALASGVNAGLPEATPLRWKDTKPTNKFAHFDNYKSTAIVAAATITQTVKPGVISAMAFFGLEGDTLQVVARPASGGVPYFDTTYALSTYITVDLYWEWYFGQARQQQNLRITTLYPQDAQVEITLTPSPTTARAAIGIWVLGGFENLGDAQYGFKVQPTDYSRITTDPYGNVSIVKGLAAKNLTGECFMEAVDAQATAELVYRLLGTPVAVVMSENPDYDYLSAFGLMSADITAAGPTHALLSLTVKGFI